MIENYMQLAFEESRLAVGTSRPNPAVGAVVVKDGIVVGRGRTQRPGQAHAEVMALRDAGELARGASIFVTLEPCCHYGRTPPCTKAIMEAGIKNVFFAHADPNPLVRGKSRLLLEKAGIVVFEGLDACEKAQVKSSWSESCGADGCMVLQENRPMNSQGGASENIDQGRLIFLEIERFFEAYDYFVRFKHTFVEVKSAITQDGYMGIENADGSHAPLKITGPGADCWNHELRSISDGLLVGAGTLLADNPSLTVRFAQGNSPVKIVWAGSHEFTAAEASNLQAFASPETLIFSCVCQPHLCRQEVVTLRKGNFGENWQEMLENLTQRGMHRLMVEPGAKLAALLFKSGLWNRLDLWQSSNDNLDLLLEQNNLKGLAYPELPSGLVAKESYLVAGDVLTVYEKAE